MRDYAQRQTVRRPVLELQRGETLFYREGLAVLEYSIPDRRLVVHDTMPTTWNWMEVHLPIQMPDKNETRWPAIRYERTECESEIVKSIRVT